MSWERVLLYLAAGLGLLLLAALLWPLARHRFIYPGGTLSPARSDPALYGLPAAEEVWLETEDGVRLHAWWTPAEGDASGAVLYCHGNAETLVTRAWIAERLARLGYHTLLFDYRGYGLSDGRASEEGLARDARAAWRHVVEERRVAPERVVLMGHSLGSAVATRLALELQGDPDSRSQGEAGAAPGGPGPTRSDRPAVPAALVAGSPFPDMPTLFAHHAPWLPDIALRWGRDRHDAGSRIAEVRAPILIALGSEDEVIPPQISRAVLAAAETAGATGAGEAAEVVGEAAVVELVAVPTDHGSLMGHPEVWRRLEAFLRDALAASVTGPDRAGHDRNE